MTEWLAGPEMFCIPSLGRARLSDASYVDLRCVCTAEPRVVALAILVMVTQPRTSDSQTVRPRCRSRASRLGSTRKLLMCRSRR